MSFVSVRATKTADSVTSSIITNIQLNNLKYTKEVWICKLGERGNIGKEQRKSEKNTST